MSGEGGIGAEEVVHAPPAAVFGFLARLDNHWELADRWIRVVSLDSAGGDGAPADGGAVRVRGPLGLSRTVRTRVLAADPPGRLRGSAEVGRRTRAAITWSLSGEGDATRVRLRADVERMGTVDRVLWALGGRRWMRRRFGAVLGALARRFDAVGTSGDAGIDGARP
jgi:hypothetical protein